MKTDKQTSVFADMGRRHGKRIAALFSEYQYDGNPENGEDIRGAVIKHGAEFAKKLSEIVEEKAEEKKPEVENIERYDGKQPSQLTPEELAAQKAEKEFLIMSIVGVILIVVLAFILYLLKTSL